MQGVSILIEVKFGRFDSIAKITQQLSNSNLHHLMHLLCHAIFYSYTWLCATGVIVKKWQVLGPFVVGTLVLNRNDVALGGWAPN